MKKLALAFLMVTGSAALFALPTFNPMEPALLKEGFFFTRGVGHDGSQSISEENCYDIDSQSHKSLTKILGFRIGYCADFVFNRKAYDVLQQPVQDEDFVSKVEPFTEAFAFTTASALMSISIMDRFEVFTTLGVMQSRGEATIKVRPRMDDFHLLDDDEGLIDRCFITMTHKWSTPHFAWSLGGSAILWSCDHIVIGCNGQYFHANPTFSRTNKCWIKSLDSLQDCLINEWSWHEWQVGFGGAWPIHFSSKGGFDLAPYCNVKYTSGGSSSIKKAPVAFDIQQHIGYAIGATFVERSRTYVTIEGRWLDEKAMYINAQLQF